jgi:hypothetical protein
LSDLAAAGLDLSAIDVVMVFPAFSADSAGAVNILDNVSINENGNEAAPPPPPPSDIVVALSIFENVSLPGWAPWNCCGNSIAPAVVTDDVEHDQVVEFGVTTGTVQGFTTREVDGAVGGVPFDASAYEAEGTFSFELKLMTDATSGPRDWLIKLESPGAATFAELPLADAQEAYSAPVVGEWQTYTFNLSDLAAAGLDLSTIDVVMVFPAFSADSAGAVYRLDNVSINENGNMSVVAGPPGGIADVGDTGLVMNGGFETSDLTGWMAEGADIAVELDDMGTYLVKLVAPEAQNPFIRQTRIGEGVIVPGQALTVSFDMKGTASDGGVVNVLLFTEASSGVSKTDNLLAGAAPTADWSPYSFNVTAGTDTEWGLALLLQPACGAVPGCEVTAYFDNVVITIAD